MAAGLEAAEAEFAPVGDSPEAVEKEHFLEEFSPANVTAAKLAEFKAKYSGLAIASVEDRKGYELVHTARMEIRNHRTAVEKVRVRLKEESLAYGRKVDAEAKRLTALLLEIEKPLEAEEKRIDAEKERIKAEKQKEADAKLQRRIDALTAVGAPANVADLTGMKDDIFEMVLKTATEAWELKEKERKAAEEALAKQREAERLEAERKAQEEAERKAKEEAALKAERERLAAERAEQERQAEALRKEREALEAEKRRQEQAAREEQIRREAEEKAKAEAERRAREEEARKVQEAERIAREKAQAEADRKAREAARPDAEKLLAVASSLGTYRLPEMATEAGKAAMKEVKDALGRFVTFIEKKAEGLTK